MHFDSLAQVVPFLFVFIGAIFNAIHDTVNFRYHESVFRNLDPWFWDNSTSYLMAKKIFGYKIDAFHLAKSLMLFSLFGAILSYERPVFGILDFIAFGLVWNVTFNLFYNKIFWI